MAFSVPDTYIAVMDLEATANNGQLAVAVIDVYDHFASLVLLRRYVTDATGLIAGLGLDRDETDLVGDGSEAHIRGALGRWKPATNATSVLYWAGHGSTNAGHLYLWCRGTPEWPRDDNAIPGRTLGQLLAAKGVRQTLLFLDACSAAGGAQEIAEGFRDEVRRHSYRDPESKPSLAIISAADHDQPAREGAFSLALATALRQGGWWSDHDRFIYTVDIVDAVAANLSALGYGQVPQHDMVGIVRLDNPDYRRLSPDLDVETKRTKQRWLSSRAAQHFLLKFRGIDTPDETGWSFTGRREELAQIVTWLFRSKAGMLVVTGPPGCGKSALLGHLAIMSDPHWREQAARGGALRDLTPDVDPGLDAFDVGIHCKNKTVIDCIEEIGEILGLAPPLDGWSDPRDLVRGVARIGRQVTLLFDALDEAHPTDQWLIATELLRPLAQLPSVRVIVGTRPRRALSLREQDSYVGLDQGLLETLEASVILNLRDDERATEAIAAHVEWRLLNTTKSPYRDEPVLARTVAEKVAEHSDGIFLLGRLLGRALAGSEAVIEPTSAEFGGLLSGGIADAFHADLLRFGVDYARVRDLLAALAWAEGHGLPRREVWISVANAIALVGGSPGVYTVGDVVWLLNHAGAHVIESAEDDQAVYRLYHQSYGDYFRRGQQARAVQSQITASLLRLADTTGRDWAAVNPYLRRHLATHAAAGGRLEELVDDADFLCYADPSRLVQVLGQVDHRTHDLCRLYWRAADQMIGAAPADRASRLQAVALVDEPAALPRLRTRELSWAGVWSRGPRASFNRRMSSHQGSARAVAATTSEAGVALIASGGFDRTVRVSSVLTGEYLRTLAGHSRSVTSLAFGLRAGGDLVLASGSEDGNITLWNPITGVRGLQLRAHNPGVNCLAFVKTGDQTLVSGGADGEIAIWNTVSGDQMLRLRGHTGGVRDLSTFDSTDFGPVVVTGSGDATVRLWDIESGSCLRVLSKHDDWVEAVACREFEEHLLIVSGTARGTVRAWFADARAPLWEHRSGGWVRTLGFVDVADHVFLAVTRDYSRSIELLDPLTGYGVSRAQGFFGTIQSISSTEFEGRKLLITGTTEGQVQVWDLATLGEVTAGDRQARLLGGHDTIAWSESRDSIVVGQASSGNQIATMTLPRDAVGMSIANLGDRLSIAAVDSKSMSLSSVQKHDGTVTLEHYKIPRLRMARVAGAAFSGRHLIGLGSPLESVVVLLDPSNLALPSTDGSRATYSYDVPIENASSRDHTRPGVYALALGSVAGIEIVVAVTDMQTLLIWDLRSTRLLRTISRATNATQHGFLTLVGADDHSLLLTTEGVYTLRRTSDSSVSVSNVARYSSDLTYARTSTANVIGGRVYIATGDAQGRVTVWSWPDRRPCASIQLSAEPDCVVLAENADRGEVHLVVSGGGQLMVYEISALL